MLERRLFLALLARVRIFHYFLRTPGSETNFFGDTGMRRTVMPRLRAGVHQNATLSRLRSRVSPTCVRVLSLYASPGPDLVAFLQHYIAV